ncbi:MAG TPA: ComEC/Rec2 family competence protein, partial [Candidatus Paceibacterota bacterium]|nr:ComEC/Rec2 family competence protein [Candidatus Paceibacterota bacterium]
KFLFSLKHTFEHSIEKLFPEPDNSLLEGILLGERSGLPDALNHAFIVSSLVHVVVLSGYNISIVANAMLYVTSFLPKVFSYGLGGVLMILFALMTGAGATTVRACIMGLISILAQYLERPTIAMRSLLFAAGAMILWNPLIALYDSSFILSVLATFGLITLEPTVERYVRFMPEQLGIRSITASTIAVQIFVLPALLYFTGILSFIALPANLLALPVVPFAMLLGFIAGMFGFVHPLLALPFTILGDALLKWMMLVATTATALPFSSAVVAGYPAWLLVAIYIPLTVFATWRYLRTASRQPSN